MDMTGVSLDMTGVSLDMTGVSLDMTGDPLDMIDAPMDMTGLELRVYTVDRFSECARTKTNWLRHLSSSD